MQQSNPYSQEMQMDSFVIYGRWGPRIWGEEEDPEEELFE
jgi:hypothetical protein